MLSVLSFWLRVWLLRPAKFQNVLERFIYSLILTLILKTIFRHWRLCWGRKWKAIERQQHIRLGVRRLHNNEVIFMLEKEKNCYWTIIGNCCVVFVAETCFTIISPLLVLWFFSSAKCNFGASLRGNFSTKHFFTCTLACTKHDYASFARHFHSSPILRLILSLMKRANWQNKSQLKSGEWKLEQVFSCFFHRKVSNKIQSFYYFERLQHKSSEKDDRHVTRSGSRRWDISYDAKRGVKWDEQRKLCLLISVTFHSADWLFHRSCTESSNPLDQQTNRFHDFIVQRFVAKNSQLIGWRRLWSDHNWLEYRKSPFLLVELAAREAAAIDRLNGLLASQTI